MCFPFDISSPPIKMWSKVCIGRVLEFLMMDFFHWMFPVDLVHGILLFLWHFILEFSPFEFSHWNLPIGSFPYSLKRLLPVKGFCFGLFNFGFVSLRCVFFEKFLFPLGLDSPTKILPSEWLNVSIEAALWIFPLELCPLAFGGFPWNHPLELYIPLEFS